jgi:hypothetical protein
MHETPSPTSFLRPRPVADHVAAGNLGVDHDSDRAAGNTILTAICRHCHRRELLFSGDLTDDDAMCVATEAYSQFLLRGWRFDKSLEQGGLCPDHSQAPQACAETPYSRPDPVDTAFINHHHLARFPAIVLPNDLCNPEAYPDGNIFQPAVAEEGYANAPSASS